MRRKSERTKDKDKTSPDKKPEKPSRRSRRHSRRRKKSVSTSPERDDSGTEDNEASFKSSQDDTEDEQQPNTVVDESTSLVGAVITAEEGRPASDVEERLGGDSSQAVPTRSRRSLKRHNVEECVSTSDGKVQTTVREENIQDDDWKEDKTFWEEGDINADTSDQKHKEKEGKSSVWKVKSANGSGGEIQKLKLCIVRPQEAEEPSPSPRRRKRLSRTPSNQQVHKDKESVEAEQDRRQTRDSSEEKQKSCDSSEEKRKSKRLHKENRDSSEEKVKHKTKMHDLLEGQQETVSASQGVSNAEDVSQNRITSEDSLNIKLQQDSDGNESVVLKEVLQTTCPEIVEPTECLAQIQNVPDLPAESPVVQETFERESVNPDLSEERTDMQESSEEIPVSRESEGDPVIREPSEEKKDSDSSDDRPLASVCTEEKKEIVGNSSGEISRDQEPSDEISMAKDVLDETTKNRNLSEERSEGGHSSEERPLAESLEKNTDSSEESKPQNLLEVCPASQDLFVERVADQESSEETIKEALNSDIQITQDSPISIVPEERGQRVHGSSEDTPNNVVEKDQGICKLIEDDQNAESLAVEDIVEKRVHVKSSSETKEERDSSEERSKSASCSTGQKNVSSSKENLKSRDVSRKRSREIRIHRKSRDSVSSDDKETRKRSKSKESSSHTHAPESRTSRRENKDSHRRRSQDSPSPEHRNSRRRGSEFQTSSKHKRRHSTSKSRSPQQRREKVALRRSFSGKNEPIENKDIPEDGRSAVKPTESSVEVQINHKENKENREKKCDEEAHPVPEVPAIVPRKRRWGASNSSRPSKKPVLSISTDSLKNLIPGAKPLPIGEVQLTQDEDIKKDRENEREEGERREKDRDKPRERENREQSPERKHSVMLPDAPRISVAVTDDQRGKVITRKISIVADDARNLQRSPSPPRHKASSVLFITNLVRPFTVQQLRELLARTGAIVEGGFWIDKIKSKCYVQYEKEAEARETRHALHGVRWPVSNPKQLCVDFGRKEDMELAQVLAETDQIPRKTEPLKVERSVEGWVAEQVREKEREQREQREREMQQREKERERERDRERARLKERPHAMPLEAIEHNRNMKMSAIREWDLGKIGGQLSPNERDLRYDERNRERERKIRKEKIHRSRSPSLHELSVRKSKKKEEDAPAKLLDDLFRKTKSTPCIYWLPLNAEQIVVKEEMRRKHMAEHERRMAEMRKAERERERVRAQQRQQRRTGERDRRRRRSGSGSPKK